MAPNHAQSSRDVAIAERRRKCGELYLQGRTQTEIGIELRVGQPCVSKDLAFLRKEWLAAAVMDFNAAKARELARIDTLEREAWDAYAKSKAAKVRRLAEKVQRGKGDVETRTQQIEEESYGDPRLLDRVAWCIEQRLKIFGVYDADKRDTDWKKWLMEHGYQEKEVFEELVGYFTDRTSKLESAAVDGGGSGSGTA